MENPPRELHPAAWPQGVARPGLSYLGSHRYLTLVEPMTPDERRVFDRHVLAAEGYLGLGMAKDAWGELEEIDAPYQRSPDALKVRVDVLKALENWGPMADEARLLSAHEPNEPCHVLSLAYAVGRHENLQAAEKILEEAFSRFPTDAGIPYSLAHCRAALGKTGEAKYMMSVAFTRDERLRPTVLGDPDQKAFWEGCARVQDQLRPDPAHVGILGGLRWIVIVAIVGFQALGAMKGCLPTAEKVAPPSPANHPTFMPSQFPSPSGLGVPKGGV